MIIKFQGYEVVLFAKNDMGLGVDIEEDTKAVVNQIASLLSDKAEAVHKKKKYEAYANWLEKDSREIHKQLDSMGYYDDVKESE